MIKQPETLNEWVNYLASEEFPVLSETMSRLGNLDDFVSDFPSEMSAIILQDPNMTTRVLKMANSAYYNLGRTKISTVSRAVMFLGYDTIRSICLSSGVFQQLLKKDPSDRLLRGISSSFQAGVQSQEIARAHGDKAPEELFISSMLFHIGEMAFWTFGGEAAREINRLMVEEGYDQLDAQKEVLGFRLSELTYGLAKRWGMSDVLLDALQRRDTPESDSRNIILSHRLLSTSHNGWNNPKTKQVIRDLSNYTNTDVEQMRKLLIDSAEQTVEVLKGHGFNDLIANLNFPPGTNIDLNAYQPKRVNLVEKRTKDEVKKPDQEVIDNIMEELTILHNEENQLDINFVLQLVLESIHRGTGMDRALVALINDHKQLVGKSAVQDRSTSLIEDFSFTLEATPLFRRVIKDHKILWSRKALHGPMAGELLAKFQVMLGTSDFLMGPLLVQGKAIGIYYGDRQITSQNLTLAELKAFEQVVNIANETLSDFGC